jgi:hypothetical protein
LLRAIRARTWRGEASLCRQFDKDWRKHTQIHDTRLRRGRWHYVYGIARSPDVEDALYALVRAGKIEWFGGGTTGEEPLKYREVRRGR